MLEFNMKRIIILVIILSGLSFAQKNNPDKILDKVKDNFSVVKDYQVDVDIKLDVNFLKAPDMHAKIYFKKPDKIHIESKNFALLPRMGFDVSPASILKNQYTAIFVRDTLINDTKTAVIKIIPLEEHGDILLSTLWVDIDKNLIDRIESSTKVNGNYTIDLKYSPEIKYPLPKSIVFSFNEDRLKFLKKNLPPEDNDEENSEEQPKLNTDNPVGKVYINYSNYIVNKGIPDSVFTEEKH
jgi:hypothetical protein